jgi:hypothetical protein
MLSLILKGQTIKASFVYILFIEVLVSVRFNFNLLILAGALVVGTALIVDAGVADVT